MGANLAKEFPPAAHPPTSGTQAISAHRRKTPVADAIIGCLVVYFGPFTADGAVTGCCHALGRDPDSLELHDVPQVLAALRPMLATLLGDASCRILLHRIAQNLGTS